jgi:hypothetical protein
MFLGRSEVLIRLILICVLAGGAFSAGGCGVRDARTGELLPQGDQRFAYATVKQQAERLRVGMTRTEVSILLGSPAFRDGDDWIYRDDRDGLIVPAEAMRLKFSQRRYVSHHFEPIVLGERVPLPQ